MSEQRSREERERNLSEEKNKKSSLAPISSPFLQVICIILTFRVPVWLWGTKDDCSQSTLLDGSADSSTIEEDNYVTSFPIS